MDLCQLRMKLLCTTVIVLNYIVIEHSHSKIHEAAVDIDKKEKQWNSNSDRHPWLLCLKEDQVRTIRQSNILSTAINHDHANVLQNNSAITSSSTLATNVSSPSIVLPHTSSNLCNVTRGHGRAWSNNIAQI